MITQDDFTKANSSNTMSTKTSADYSDNIPQKKQDEPVRTGKQRRRISRRLKMKPKLKNKPIF